MRTEAVARNTGFATYAKYAATADPQIPAKTTSQRLRRTIARISLRSPASFAPPVARESGAVSTRGHAGSVSAFIGLSPAGCINPGIARCGLRESRPGTKVDDGGSC